MWKKTVRVIVFSLLVVILSGNILNILNYKDMGGGGGWQRFYKAQDNSCDVIAFGSSHAHCTVNHGLLWDEYGIAGYTLSAGSQELDSTFYFVREALKTQHPRVIMVEVLGIGDAGEICNTEKTVYRNTLGMKWSSNFIDYIQYLSEDMDMSRNWKEEILTKMPVIHSRYAELEEADFQDNIPFMRGYRGSYEMVSFEQPSALDIEETMEITPERLNILRNIIDYAKSRDVQVLLFASPFILADEYQMRFNALAQFADENDVTFIDFNKLHDEIGLDYAVDFRDESHVNNYGAAKVSSYLGNVLKEQYALPDRRGEEDYQLWEQNALYLRNKELRHDLSKQPDINEYLKCLAQSQENNTVILTLNGNYTVLGDAYLEGLEALGISSEEYETGGAWIFRAGERVLHMPGNQYAQCLKTDSGEIHLESRASFTDDDEMTETAQILINGMDYRMVDNGVNIVVYNEELNQMIDAAGDDVYLGLEMTHYDLAEE